MRRKFVQQQKLLETLQNPKLQRSHTACIYKHLTSIEGTHPKSSDLAGSYALNEGNPEIATNLMALTQLFDGKSLN